MYCFSPASWPHSEKQKALLLLVKFIGWHNIEYWRVEQKRHWPYMYYQLGYIPTVCEVYTCMWSTCACAVHIHFCSLETQTLQTPTAITYTGRRTHNTMECLFSCAFCIYNTCCKLCLFFKTASRHPTLYRRFKARVSTSEGCTSRSGTSAWCGRRSHRCHSTADSGQAVCNGQRCAVRIFISATIT